MGKEALLLILCVTVHQAIGGQQLYHEELIYKSSGLYLEGMPPVRRITSSWSILTSFDLQDIYIYTEPMEPLILKFIADCPSVGCVNLGKERQEWGVADREVTQQWELLCDYLRPFGTDMTIDHRDYTSKLTEDSAALYNRIEPLFSRERQTKDSNRVSHLTSGLVDFMTEIDSQYDLLSELTKKIAGRNKTVFLTEALSSSIINILQSINRSRYDLLQFARQIVMNAKQGLIHSFTFQPEHLRAKLAYLSTKNPSSFIPLPADGVGLTQLQDITTTQLAIRKGRVIITLQIPFAKNITDEIYRIHPHLVFQKISNRTTFFAYIEPSADYLWLTEKGKKYSLISQEYFSKSCKRVNEYLICTPPTLFHAVTNNSPCELALYHNLSNRTLLSCDIKMVGAPIDSWITLERPGSWLYSLIEPKMAQLKCPSFPDIDVPLTATGRIEIEPGCVLETKNARLTNSDSSLHSPHISDHIPDYHLNLTELYPEIWLFIDQLKFDQQTGFTDVISLAIIKRNLSQKHYHTKTIIQLEEPSYPWKLLSILNMCLIIYLFVYKWIAECSAKRSRKVKTPDNSHVNIFSLEPTGSDSMNQVESPRLNTRKTFSTFRPDLPLNFAFSSIQTPNPVTTTIVDMHPEGYYSIPRNLRDYKPLSSEPEASTSQENQ